MNTPTMATMRQRRMVFMRDPSSELFPIRPLHPTGGRADDAEALDGGLAAVLVAQPSELNLRRCLPPREIFLHPLHLAACPRRCNAARMRRSGGPPRGGSRADVSWLSL